ncbi:ubiquitin carboxyl-terminal hydrolase 27 [Zea mays]|uniref:ubiquitin carboxyl-terminal hydrolase 27 n=1 Tax=Zea mays TaxID=4577 RepID=UPI0004DEB1C3|nr:ubiquitin carboxyl-terminal hydrolase 27 [Zea mays]|eukprot:XP_023156959.1 ubiquitin carboxyl-terminal hydrolase 27-like [Zea mays]
MNLPIVMYHIGVLWQTSPFLTPKYTSKGKLSLDFENFHCLPLLPVLNANGDITSGCSLVDCLKYFTVVEHLDNYRCDRCWHIIAAKYLSLRSEVDEEKVSKASILF